MDTITIELTKEEASAMLEALAAMPLSKSYNLFNKLLSLANKANEASKAPPQSN